MSAEGSHTPNSSLPMISVIMPAFNRAEFIPQAIESVLSQDYPNCEIMVVDDGSTNSTPAIVRRYSSSRVRYLRRDHGGPAAARNAGIESARGAWIAFLDSDDYFLPGKLTAQARLLASDRRLGAVHSGWQTVDEKGNTLQTVEPWKTAPRLDLRTWLMWKPVFLGGILIRAEWLRKAGPFNPRLFQTDDVEMMFRLSAAGCRMRWLKRATVCYRRHAANITRDSQRQAGDLMAAVDSFFATLALPARVREWEPSVRYYTLLWLAFDSWRIGRPDRMAAQLKQTIPFAEQSPDQIPVAWHAHLFQRALEFGIGEKTTAALGETLAGIPIPGGLDPEHIRKTLAWLTECWWEYLQGRIPSPEHIAALSNGVSVPVMVKSLQTTLIAGAWGDPLPALGRFWADLGRAHAVPASRRFEATTLYLTVFSQAVFRRNGRTAVAALARALREGATPRAWPVWSRFVRAAAEYFLSPKSRKPNRIAAAKKSIQ